MTGVVDTTASCTLAAESGGSREVWLVGGTRPEALKLAPLLAPLEEEGLAPVVVASGQHPLMFHQGMAAFGLVPDVVVPLRRESGEQAELAARLLEGLDAELAAAPAAVVVQGDTATALAGALAAFWRRVPVVHLEAGLRSHDLDSPFPEEANRRLIGQIAALHLAPTSTAAANLRAEGIPEALIRTVGNTVVDAVLAVAERDAPLADPALAGVDLALAAGRRLCLVTVHRRESWGEPLERVLAAVVDLLDRHPDLLVVLPAHPNPAVGRVVRAALAGRDRAVVVEPVDYPDLVGLLRRATLVLSDSGGIQEEAPSFGVPVLVLRDRTERTEAVDAGCARLVGTDRDLIVAWADRLLTDPAAAQAMRAITNPFGDGRAAERSAAAVAELVAARSSAPSRRSARVPT